FPRPESRAILRILIFAAALVLPGLATAQASFPPTPMFLSLTLMIDDPRLGVSVGPNLFRLGGERSDFQLAPRAPSGQMAQSPWRAAAGRPSRFSAPRLDQHRFPRAHAIAGLDPHLEIFRPRQHEINLRADADHAEDLALVHALARLEVAVDAGDG